MEIAIVGAGIGGLISALLLEQEGFKITIFEKEATIGGRLAYQTNGKYKIDQGPTIILLPELLLEILEEAGISKELIQMIPCEPLYDIHYPTGKTFTKYRDLPQQLKEIERCFPGESTNFLHYLADMGEIYESGLEAFLKKSFNKKRDFYTLENMKLLWNAKAYKTVKEFSKSYFENEELSDAYTLQSLYIGGSPYEASALYGLVSYSEHAHGIWYLKGGYAGLVEVLQQRCVERDIKIITNCKVDSFLIKNDICYGVKTKDGSIHYDSVIFNGDFPTVFSLMDNTQQLNKKNFKASSGCVLVYLGVKKRFPQSKMHQFFMSSDFEKHMKQVFKTKEVPKDPSFYVFNPVALDVEAANSDESVLYFLIPVPSGDHIDWDKEKTNLVNHVLQRAEKELFSELQEHIEWMDIRTPQDSLQQGLFEGGSFGIAPVLLQSGAFRPQNIPFPIKHLYCVGASIHPGGGVPIVMQGARLLRNQLKKEMGNHVAYRDNKIM